MTRNSFVSFVSIVSFDCLDHPQRVLLVVKVYKQRRGSSGSNCILLLGQSQLFHVCLLRELLLFVILLHLAGAARHIQHNTT